MSFLAFVLRYVAKLTCGWGSSMTERDIEKIAEEWDKDEEEDPDDPMVKKRKMMER